MDDEGAYGERLISCCSCDDSCSLGRGAAYIVILDVDIKVSIERWRMMAEYRLVIHSSIFYPRYKAFFVAAQWVAG